jgi:hypothetical protein
LSFGTICIPILKRLFLSLLYTPHFYLNHISFHLPFVPSTAPPPSISPPFPYSPSTLTSPFFSLYTSSAHTINSIILLVVIPLVSSSRDDPHIYPPFCVSSISQ